MMEAKNSLSNPLLQNKLNVKNELKTKNLLMSSSTEEKQDEEERKSGGKLYSPNLLSLQTKESTMNQTGVGNKLCTSKKTKDLKMKKKTNTEFAKPVLFNTCLTVKPTPHNQIKYAITNKTQVDQKRNLSKPNLFSTTPLTTTSTQNKYVGGFTLLSQPKKSTYQAANLTHGNLTTQLPSRKIKSKTKEKHKKHQKFEEEETIFVDYDLTLNDDEKEREIVAFRLAQQSKQVNVFVENKDVKKEMMKELERINLKKVRLINIISITLMKAPDLKDCHDQTRQLLMKKLTNIAKYDPEFILKLALYTRQHLNIRSVSNFLLAFAAYLPNARPFLKKYFSKSIGLPSDWIDVAEMYRTFFDDQITFGALPTALRKAMIAKFPDFDEYQLGKYNKDSSKTKTTKLVNYPKKFDPREPVGESDDEEEETLNHGGYSREMSWEDDEFPSVVDAKCFSLKNLIRKLHVTEPVYHVMCLIGKKYPETLDEFYQSRLPGTFDEERAGKRMKLKTPETWETQVSLKGNKSTTWQDLIDRKKLPFMAMLRNLRNMIIAGISSRHHKMIMKRLTDVKSIVNSRQFPFRFLSAYEVIDELEEMLEKSLNGEVSTPTFGRGRGRGMRGGRGRGRGRGRGGSSGVPVPLNTFNKDILRRYKQALEGALKISTVHNIPPIGGTTVVLISLESDMAHMILANAKAFTKKRKVIEMCLLLGLMCNYHCEDAVFILHDSRNDRYVLIEQSDTNKILENIEHLVKQYDSVYEDSTGHQDIYKYFESYLTQKKKFFVLKGISTQVCYNPQKNGMFKNVDVKVQIDNFLVIGAYLDDEFLSDFLQMYRKEVHSTCLGVFVDVMGGQSGGSLIGDHDVRISAFSDQVLRYISERGNGGQLTFVENIDLVHNLQDIKVHNSLKVQPVNTQEFSKIERPLMKWRTIRVFISSTFRDMHGERDLLTRHVFPELRRWCFNYCLNVYEVDLRWGISEKQAQNNSQLEICLHEVLSSDLFVGIVGSRYGWRPETYALTQDYPGLEWLQQTKPGLSITHLEMKAFTMKHGNESQNRAFFFLRDQLKLKDIPKQYRKDFVERDDTALVALDSLKNWLKSSGMEVFDKYPCRWGTAVDHKPALIGLEAFGQRVLNNLWNAIKKNFISKQQEIKEADESDDVAEHIEEQAKFAEELSDKFVGRSKLTTKVIDVLNELVYKDGRNLVLVTGHSGSGKTAFMGNLYVSYKNSHPKNTVFCYFAELNPSTSTLGNMLRYFCEKINERFSLGLEIPESYRELKQCFEDAIKKTSKRLKGEQLLIFLDGLNQMCSENVPLADWIPDDLPKGVVLVISCIDNTLISKRITHHKQFVENIRVGAMELADRAVFIQRALTKYGKSLDESPFNNQMKLLLSKKDSASPLYLRLACEELRLFGVYEKLNDHLRNLSQTLPQLIEFTLHRLEDENSKQLITDALVVLYYSRQGLKDDELFDVLNMLNHFQSIPLKDVVKIGARCYFKAEFMQQKIPRSYFLKMFRSLKMFLSETTPDVFSLLFTDIRSVVEKHYIHLGGEEYVTKLQIALAGYYCKQADPNNDLLWKSGDRKALIELPHHLDAAGLWKELRATLCSIAFIKAKVEAGLCLQLLEDFYMTTSLLNVSKLKSRERNNIMKTKEVEEVKLFISKNIHVFIKYPKLLLQQAINSLCDFSEDLNSVFSKEELQNVIQWTNKATQQSSCVLTIAAIQKPVLCISLSKDESMIACGLADGQVILYDRNTTKELKAFIGHASEITSCSFAGLTKLCTASVDGQISVWDVEGGHRLYLLTNHTRQVSSCVATMDGKLLLSTSWDATAKLWSLTDGKTAGELTGKGHPFNCVALDPTEKHAALGCWDTEITIWNILENIKVSVYKGHQSSVRALAYSPSGNHLASASLAGEILLWSTKNGTKVGEMSYRSFPIKRLAYNPTGSQLIAASTDTSIKVWSGSLGCPELENSGSATNYALSVAVHDGMVYVGYNSGLVRVFDKNNTVSSEWKAHSSSVRSMCFIKDRSNTHLLTASDDFIIKRWKLEDSNPCLVSRMNGHTAAVKCVRAKESNIISASEDMTVRVWPGIVFEGSDAVQDSTVFRGHTSVVTCCDLSNCETMAISGSSDRTIIVWDLNTHTSLVHLYGAHNDGITTCCWSDVGYYVVTGSNDFTLKLWDTRYLIENKDKPEKLKEKIQFVGHVSTINDVKYKFGCVVSATANGTVKVWTHKGVEVTSMKLYESRINCCDVWAPLAQDQSEEWALDSAAKKGVQQLIKDGQPSSLHDVLVYTVSDEGSWKSCRPFKSHLIKELYGHADVVTDILPSTINASEIITSSLDASVKVWQVNSEDVVKHHSGEVKQCVMYDDQLAASCGHDKMLLIHSNNQIIDSFQLEAPVKAISFVSRDLLVVGDTRGVVLLYSLQERGVKTEQRMDSPIQDLVFAKSSASGYIIIVCYRSVEVYQSNLKRKLKSLDTIMCDDVIRPLKYPMTSIQQLDDGQLVASAIMLPAKAIPDEFIPSSGKHLSYYLFDIETLMSSTDLDDLRKSVISIPRYVTTSITMQQRAGESYVYLGSPDGEVLRLNDDSEDEKTQRIKMHDGAVTGLLVFDETMVTASRDSTVKIWQIQNDDAQPSQIGLYYCRAPITTLAGRMTHDGIHLLVGDDIGNVTFLVINRKK